MAAVSTLGWPKGTSSSVLFHYNCASLPFLEVGMMPWRIKHCSLQTPEELIFLWDLFNKLVGWNVNRQSFGHSLI